MYEEVISELRLAYDRKAQDRDKSEISDWKVEERDHFLSILRDEQKQSLLEVGAGPGQFGKFFQDAGLTVVCTDLSPEMVKLCRDKCLTAHVMDFLHLDFPDASFDAVFALNCMLHVPKKDLPNVLQAIGSLLKPAGLFYMGLYGGVDSEGPAPDDYHEPKRFFSLHTDDQMREVVTQHFDLVYFKTITMTGFDFQSMILRK